MAKQKQEHEDQRTRRAVGYPASTLRLCLKLGEAVHLAGGSSGPVPKAVIASRLGVGESASGFYALLSSARSFGIVEGTRDLMLTRGGKDYFLPTTEGEKRHAELAFFSTPDAYRYLIERFDGHLLPDTDAIANTLLKDDLVSRSWAPRIASMFTTAATDLRIIDQAGFLRFGAATHAANQDTQRQHFEMAAAPAHFQVSGSGTIPASPPKTAPDNFREAKEENQDDKNRWSYREAGGTVRLETPDPLPRALWERLKRYVDMLEPIESQGG